MTLAKVRFKPNSHRRTGRVKTALSRRVGRHELGIKAERLIEK